MDLANSLQKDIESRPATLSGERKITILAGLVLLLAAFLAYMNSLENGFVWDDLGFLVNNPALKKSPISIIWDYPFRHVDTAPYYRPMTALVFVIEERLHGLNPSMSHLFNVLTHGVNAVLVYMVARRLTKNFRTALLAGLLFAVHPINTEGVDFISTRNDIMVAFFAASSFMFYRRGLIRDSAPACVAGSLCFLAALMSKESAFGLVPMIAALETGLLVDRPSGPKSALFKRTLPYMVVIACYLVMRNIAVPGADAGINVLEGLGGRFLNNFYILPRYLLSVFWPPVQSIRYYVPEDLHRFALPLAAAWIGIVFVLVQLLVRWRSRATYFGLLWFLSFWLPVSGIIPIPSAPMADRYLYVPAMGLWIIAAEQFSRLIFSGDGLRRFSYAAAATVLTILTVFTADRNRVWKNDVTLFSSFVEQHPEQAFGHHNLGCAYLDQVGDLDKAEGEFEKALALDPFFPKLRTQLGYIRKLRGDYSGAILHYNAAIALNPSDSEAFLNRAVIMEGLGRVDEAVADYKRFLILPPGDLAAAKPQVEAKVRMLAR